MAEYTRFDSANMSWTTTPTLIKNVRFATKASSVFTDAVVEEVDEAPAKVVRSKHIDLKPMDLEEALLQMELLGHDFFIYTDVDDNTTNVIYRREDGDLGLLEVK